MLNNEIFFDQISGYYNDMISFEKALVNRKKALSEFITSDTIDAVDLGCGTGLDSISLALNNLKVTSFDISDGMISKALDKSKSLNLKIEFNKYSIPDIPLTFHNKYDLAVSLGNTLANLNIQQLKLAVLKAYNLLKEKGTFLIQILNYEQLIRSSERIVNITQSEDKHFIRFYDFLNDSINFNILTYSKDNLKDYHFSTTTLYPHSSEILKAFLTESGFKKVELYSSFNKDPFIADSSKDLLISATK